MPVAAPAVVRQQIAARTPAPIYVIVGDDDVEMSRLASDISTLVDDELRAFNLERLYATDKGVTPAVIVEAARTLPMLGDRRVVIVLRAERLLKPKRRGKANEETDLVLEAEDATGDLKVLEDYVSSPEPTSTLVFVASDLDRQRRLFKALQRTATIVVLEGLPRGVGGSPDLRQAARRAEEIVGAAVSEAGKVIDRAALRLIAERAGTDIARLRGDLERLLLYAAAKTAITIEDVQEVVSGETSWDDWAVTNAIARGNAREALRELALALDAGGISYQILGQLAWFVRDRFPAGDPKRIRPAVEALFRTDVDLKSSGGDPRVLLERLVLELCSR